LILLDSLVQVLDAPPVSAFPMAFPTRTSARTGAHPRVFYDGRVLGLLARPNPVAASGLHRVTARLAAELRASDACELVIGTSGYAAELLDLERFLGADDRFGGCAAAVPAWYRSLVRLAGSRHARLAACARLSPAARVERGARFLALRAINVARHPLTARELQGADLFHSPYFALPPVTAARRPRVLTVHDLIPLVRREWYGQAEADGFGRIPASIRADDWVIAVSEATRADLCNHRPDLDPARVVVVPWAADRRVFHPEEDACRIAAARTAYGIPRARYLLALANPSGRTLDPRKNVATLIVAFARAASGPGMEDLRLVLAGNAGWKHEAVPAELARSPRVAERIVFAGYIAEADLAAVYSGATAFVYPSLYEGFGLPPLEAMQCGVPVIASSTTSLPEVVGCAGLLVPPTDPDAIADAIRAVACDEDFQADLRARSLARAALFDWSATAARTAEVYRMAIASAS